MSPELKRKLLSRAEDAPVAWKVAFDPLRIQLERELPHARTLPNWHALVPMGMIAGCFALGVRLKFEVEKEWRTEIEMRMRAELARLVQNVEEVTLGIHELVSTAMIELPRDQRGDYMFSAIGMYVYQAISGGDMDDRNSMIFARIGILLQDESAGYWSSVEEYSKN